MLQRSVTLIRKLVCTRPHWSRQRTDSIVARMRVDWEGR